MYIFQFKLHNGSLKDWLWPKVFKMRTKEILPEHFISVMCCVTALKRSTCEACKHLLVSKNWQRIWRSYFHSFTNCVRAVLGEILGLCWISVITWISIRYQFPAKELSLLSNIVISMAKSIRFKRSTFWMHLLLFNKY